MPRENPVLSCENSIKDGGVTPYWNEEADLSKRRRLGRMPEFAHSIILTVQILPCYPIWTVLFRMPEQILSIILSEPS